MALFQPKQKPVATYSSDVASKIQQRRYQILVHSLIYYELDINLVSDSQWSRWAVELAELQRAHPEVANTVIFADAFKNFDGSTGFDLPYKDEQILNIAYKLLKSCGDAEAKNAVRRLLSVNTTPAEYSGFASKPSKQPIQTHRKVVKKDEPVKRKKLF